MRPPRCSRLWVSSVQALGFRPLGEFRDPSLRVLCGVRAYRSDLGLRLWRVGLSGISSFRIRVEFPNLSQKQQQSFDRRSQKLIVILFKCIMGTIF